MPQATTSRKRSTAARAETNGKKTVDFRGLKLKVPAKCPGEVLFDIGDDDISGTLRTLLGRTQYEQIRGKVAEEGLGFDETRDALTDFLNSLFSNTYGITAGE